MDKELRVALEYANEMVAELKKAHVEDSIYQPLIDLAQAYLEVQGFPERRENLLCETQLNTALKNHGWNACLKASKLAHLKQMQKEAYHINHATCHECPCKLNFDKMKKQVQELREPEVEFEIYARDEHIATLKKQMQDMCVVPTFAELHKIVHRCLTVPGVRATMAIPEAIIKFLKEKGER